MTDTRQTTPAAAAGDNQPGAAQRSGSSPRKAPAKKAASAPSGSTTSVDPLAAFRAQASARRRELADELADIDAQQKALADDDETLVIAAHMAEEHIRAQQQVNRDRQRELDQQVRDLRTKAGLSEPAPTTTTAPAAAPVQDITTPAPADSQVQPDPDKVKEYTDRGVASKYAVALSLLPADKVREDLNIDPDVELTDQDTINGALYSVVVDHTKRLDDLENALFVPVYDGDAQADHSVVTTTPVQNANDAVVETHTEPAASANGNDVVDLESSSEAPATPDRPTGFKGAATRAYEYLKGNPVTTPASRRGHFA